MSSQRLPRSPELMNRDDSALVVVDVQEKLLPLVAGHERIAWNIGRLLDGAKILNVPAVATEQYPKGLGRTLPELAAKIDAAIPDKLLFSCGACGELFTQLAERGVNKLLLCGIEAHVCVQQTAMDLMAAGFRIYLAVDAIGARYDIDRDIALRRMESSGATLTTTEAALFEWCEVAGTQEFKAISQLVKQGPPVA
jgi:nicotinamidase-related amidase